MIRGLVGVSLTDPLTMIQRLQLINSFHEWTRALELEIELDPGEFTTIAELYGYILKSISQPGDVVVGHKTTMAHRIVGRLLRCVPDLKVIYCIRDPRDVVTSALKRFADEDTPLFEYIDQWQKSYITIRNYLRNPEFNSRILLLKYEDFIIDWSRTLDCLSQFLEVEKLVIPEKMDDYGEAWQGNSAFDDLKQAIDATPVGRWKIQNPEAGRIAEILLCREMEQVGYNVSSPFENEERAQVQNQYMEYCLMKAGVSVGQPNQQAESDMIR